MKIFIPILTFAFSILGYSQCVVAKAPDFCVPLKTTGSKQLDKFLSKEIKLLEKSFSIEVVFFPYNDAQNSSVYTVSNSPYTITIGKKLLSEEYLEANGDFSVTAILAHQFAHLIQFQQNESPIDQNAELHADYLTGWYLGKIKGLTPDQLNLISSGFWDKKDEHYFSQDVHGSSEDRRLALLEGYKNSSKDLVSAFTSGLEYVKNINPNNIEKPLTVNPNLVTSNECLIPNPLPLDVIETFKANNALYFEAKFEECAFNYNSLIVKYPDYCVAYFNRGLALYYSGQYEKAKLDFQKSFELGFLESKKWMEKIY